jgi:hypothetical protein
MGESSFLERKIDKLKNAPAYEYEWVLLRVTDDLVETMDAAGLSRSDLAEWAGKPKSYVTQVLGVTRT